MANMIPFGATKIAQDVKDLVELKLREEDWDIRYSHTDHGYVFKREGAWTNRVCVSGGDREGHIDVDVNYGDDAPYTYHLKGDKAVEEAAEIVLRRTRE